jgi:hypothetical protein
MELVNPTARVIELRPSADRLAAGRATELRTSVVHGLSWTHTAAGERLLRAIPDSAWSDPARAGWTQVKDNGRRDVWRGSAGASAFYVKYYYGIGRLRALRERWIAPPYASEWASGLYAMRNGIPAVVPLGVCPSLRRNGKRCAVLVTAALEPALPLQDFWRQLQSDPNDSRRRSDAAQLFEQLGQLIARAHQAGLEHTDMHAANILVHTVGPRQYRCALVDLHSARLNTPITDHAVVRNLAQLHQWFRRFSALGDRVRFLRAYLRWRDAFELEFPHGRPLGLSFVELTRALAEAADTHAHALWAQRDRRGARNGRYFARLKLPGGWRGNAYLQSKHPVPESPASSRVFDRKWWGAQLPVIRAALDAPTAIAKDSHSAQVVRASLAHPDGPVEVIIKRPRARNWRRAVSQSLPPSRARRAWRMGHALIHRDVSTARPLAVFERMAGPFIRESIAVVECVPNSRDLETHLRTERPRCSPSEWLAHRRALAELLARKLRQLEDRWIHHRDCKAGNLLVVTRPSLGLTWIDMDGLRLRSRPLTEEERLAPLVRLHVSLLEVPGLSRTDRVRFLKHYASRFGAPLSAWRTIWKQVEPRARRKVEALAARREWKRAHYGRA